MKSIETKHTNELPEAEKSASDNFGSKLSEILCIIMFSQNSSENLQLSQMNSYFNLHIHRMLFFTF